MKGVQIKMALYQNAKPLIKAKDKCCLLCGKKLVNPVSKEIGLGKRCLKIIVDAVIKGKVKI